MWCDVVLEKFGLDLELVYRCCLAVDIGTYKNGFVGSMKIWTEGLLVSLIV
jgi:hypothetical protein